LRIIARENVQLLRSPSTTYKVFLDLDAMAGYAAIITLTHRNFNIDLLAEPKS
jgi:hypothetical protein